MGKSIFYKNYRNYYCWEVNTEYQFKVTKDFGDSVELTQLEDELSNNQIEKKIVQKNIFFYPEYYRIYKDYEDFIRDYSITFYSNINKKKDYACDYPETRALEQVGGFVTKKNNDNSLTLQPSDGCYISSGKVKKELYDSINIGDFYKFDETFIIQFEFDSKN